MNDNHAYRGEDVDATYIEEKSSYVIDGLVEILHILECSELTEKNKLEQIHGVVESTLYDALKIIAITIDAPWQVDDSRLIANCGDARTGWEAIQHKYTGDMKKIWSGQPFLKKNKSYLQAILDGQSLLMAEVAVRKDFCARLIPLLGGKRGEVRTVINEIMDSYSFFDPCFLRMNHLLDQVNMGNLLWNEFCLRFMANLFYLKSSLSTENAESYVQNILSMEAKRKAAKLKGEYVAPVNVSAEPSWEYQYLKEYGSKQAER